MSYHWLDGVRRFFLCPFVVFCSTSSCFVDFFLFGTRGARNLSVPRDDSSLRSIILMHFKFDFFLICLWEWCFGDFTIRVNRLFRIFYHRNAWRSNSGLPKWRIFVDVDVSSTLFCVFLKFAGFEVRVNFYFVRGNGVLAISRLGLSDSFVCFNDRNAWRSNFGLAK